MKVELVYDKRNVSEIPGANELILTELTKREHRIAPKAEVKVKPILRCKSWTDNRQLASPVIWASDFTLWVR
ncbi:TPA: hypothetical protein ACQ39K_001492 [Yersinia enterocolitica]